MNDTITNSFSEKIDFSFAPGKGENKKPGWIVVLGHGVTGDKDRPLLVATAAALNAAGYDTLRFSFSGNGDSEGEFREATVSKGAGDLKAVIDAVAVKYQHICYAGHSMGAAIGVTVAATAPRIERLVSLAGMVDTRKFAQTEFGDETPDSGLMWGEESCPLSSEFMRDLCETVRSVEGKAEQVSVPWLLLHGTADDVVLPEDTKRIQQIKGEDVDVHFIEGADHSFSGISHTREAGRLIVAWMNKLE